MRRAPRTSIIMADGFSCREQIAQETTRHALHLAEVLQMGLKTGRLVAGTQPEEGIVQRRKQSRRNARLRALGAVAAIATGAVAGWRLFNRR